MALSRTTTTTTTTSLLLAASLVLAGCFATPLRSIPRLMRLDFATMSMGEVRAGLRLPGMLRIRPGDATMTIRTRGPVGATEDVFVLVEDAEAGERADLASEARAGFALSLWRIAPHDLARVAAIQDRVRASRGQSPRIRGSIEIKVSGGCRTTVIPPGPVLMSSFLRPARGETYITLVEALDLRQVIPLADWQTKIPACA